MTNGISIQDVNKSVVVTGHVGGSITHTSGSSDHVSFDMIQLATELSKLRQAMKQRQVSESKQDESTSIEQDEAISNVGKAQKASEAKDMPKVLEYLKFASQWALDVATQIGIPVAIEAIKKANGLV